jgi:hypothetical protein
MTGQTIQAIVMKSVVLISFLLLLVGCGKKLEIIKILELKEYPSGSGMALIENRIFLIGDDAPYITILDTSLNIIDTLSLISSVSKRIPKDTKPDLEAAVTLYIDRQPYGFFIGSGSLSPFRNFGFLVNPENKRTHKISLETFYKRIKDLGIQEINIEGAAAIPGGILLSNRGNKANRRNHLIFTNTLFFTEPDSAFIKIIKVGSNSDSTSFPGVSGLDYSKNNDQLWLSVSTENTFNSFDDGEIGKSYLWMINDISSKRRLSAINPTRIFDLVALDRRFKGQKIESVCVIAQDKNKAELVLVADNDNGRTRLFKILLTY